MRLAYIQPPGSGDADRLLGRLAAALAAEGTRLCGAVRVCGAEDAGPEDGDPGRRAAMDLRLLPDGPVVRISQDLGPGARGCRLDVAALEQAAGAAERRLDAGADLVIVNRFGKRESEGRGFRGLIAEALCRGAPVLVAVAEAYQGAFLDFCAGEAERLPPDLPSLIAWSRRGA